MLLKFTFKHKKFISFLLILCTVFSMCSQLLTVFAVDGSGLVESAEKGNISDCSELNDIGLSETEAIKPNDALLTIDHPSIAKESMISKYVNAEAFNKASHIERLHSEEDLNTYVFLNANGTKSIYYMDENVKYVDKNGDVKEKDISLVSKSDGYGIARNEFDLHIPISATSGISMSYNGYEVKITPQSTARTAPARQAGEAVVYDGFFGSDTVLKYTPMLSGVKEDIILNKYIPNALFSFILETDGLGLYCNENGYYLAESESSKAVLNLGKVIVYDAVGKPEYGTMTVTTVTEGQKYIISLSAPEEFLIDPTTVYPVTIDPTLTVSDTAMGDGAIEDTTLFSNRPTKNYGDYKYLSIGYVDSTYGAGRVAVKLPGLYNSNEYRVAGYDDITSVKFYCWDTSGNSAQTVNIYRITSAVWNENEITYGDSVTYSTATNWGKSMSNAVWTAFDITSLVKSWKKGTYSAERGFIMINPNETSASYKKAPYSSEYSNSSYRPYVVMTYDKNEAAIFSFDYSGYDTTVNNSLFNSTFSTLDYSVYSSYVNSTASVAFSHLVNYDEVFVFRGHGNAGLIEFRDDNGNSTGAIAVNSAVCNRYAVGSDRKYIDSIATNGLASTKAVLYLGCSTGKDITIGSTTYNLVRATYNKGANFVLGTTQTVYTPDSNAFLRGFLNEAANGGSIAECKQSGIDEAGSVPIVDPNTGDDEWGTYPIVCTGNVNQFFN